jgi:uncharacterized protein (DUF488 family)
MESASGAHIIGSVIKNPLISSAETGGERKRPSMEEEKLTVYTIGHSIIPIEKFIALLQSAGIQTVIDVRSSPYSNYSPQFDRESLENSLKKNNFNYKFAGDYLGGRPKDPSCYKDGQIREGHADYLHLVDYPTVMIKDFFITGIERLLMIAKVEKVAVMCSEEDPAKCHRHHLIGKYLVKRDVIVLHIRGDGMIVRDQALPDLPDEPPTEQLKLF